MISIQKDVVSEVKAESALEYAAATIPNKKIIPTNWGNPEFKAIFGKEII